MTIDLQRIMRLAMSEDGEGFRIALLVLGELGRSAIENDDLRTELDEARLEWASEVARGRAPQHATTREMINDVLAAKFGQHVADRIYAAGDAGTT